MPIYEYKCLQCNEVFEVMRKIQYRKKPFVCPNCNLKTELQMSRPNVTTSRRSRPNRESQRDGSSVGITSHRSMDDVPSRTSAIHMAGESRLKMKNCRIEGFDTGISLDQNSKVEISETEFTDVRKPIEIRGSEDDGGNENDS